MDPGSPSRPGGKSYSGTQSHLALWCEIIVQTSSRRSISTRGHRLTSTFAGRVIADNNIRYDGDVLEPSHAQQSPNIGDMTVSMRKHVEDLILILAVTGGG